MNFSPEGPIGRSGREVIIDRELSWLDFNQRVLNLAEDQSIPLLERCRFLSIFSSNLDDFYMIRVATLKRKLETGVTKANSAGYTPQELIVELSQRVAEMVNRQAKLFNQDILPKLSEAGINIVHWSELSDSEKSTMRKTFTDLIFPVLTPLAVDPSHPFPYISGLSLNLAVTVANKETGAEFFARVKVPSNLARYVEVQQSNFSKYVSLEEIISENVQDLFPGMEIKNSFYFRLTRNADLELEEEDSDDLLATMEQELLRRKFGAPVRLEVEENIDSEILVTLMEEVGVSEEDVIKYQGPLDFTGLSTICDINRPDLKYEMFRNQIPWDLRDVDSESTEEFFQAIRRREVLLHHPYESFTSSVVRFIQSAASDPAVLAIKQTLYRTSGDSPVVQALIEAAQAGKQVLAVVEIRARFDEQANVQWARKLEDAGVHVVYGLVGFKTHAKLSLVVRQEDNFIRRYVHIGTGNYNPKTARMYEDFGILSADITLGEDVNRLFNQLSGLAPQTEFNRLLVAPKTLRSGLLAKIEREIENHKAGKPSGIRFKLNSILDEEFIEALFRASKAGVRVELIVRGICAIRTGIPGVSENISAISILGRFLEHSRIFHFINGGEDEIWIGSADLMHRNLDRRVEALVRIDQKDHKRLLIRAIDTYLAPSTPRWEMDKAGKWIQVNQSSDGKPLPPFHEQVINWYRARA
jgi:polyphosphate kinase